MYCPHCGSKIHKEAKFCSICGKPAGSLPEKENPLTKKPSLTKRLIALFIASAISSFMLFGGLDSKTVNPDAKSFLTVIFSVLLIFSGLFFWIAIIKLLFRKRLFFPWLKAHPKVGVVILAVVVVALLAGKQEFQRQQYKTALSQIEPMQEFLAGTLVAKSAGDSIQSGKNIPKGWTMKKVVEETASASTNLNSLKSLGGLSNYQQVSLSYSTKVELAAKNPDTWDKLSDQPEYFRVSLSDDQIKKLFKLSLVRVSELKDFGDAAVERGDRSAMRYIAAKILVQDHFINSLSLADKPSLFTFSPLAVFAVEPLTPGSMTGRKRNPCIGSFCLVDATKIVPGVYRSALGYAVGEPQSAQNLQGSWQSAAPLIEASGYAIGGTGITGGDDDKPQYPPAIQSFFNACKSRGGTVGGTGGVKERLPTTESGYTCWDEQGGGKCWDFLTYSGGRYMGGNPGCPEKGLTPAVVPPYDTPGYNTPGYGTPSQYGTPSGYTTPVSDVSSWDGTYAVQSSGECNIPGVYSSGVIPVADQFSVSGNRIITPGGDTIAIDSSGQAVYSSSVSYGGVSLQFSETFYFWQSGGQIYTEGDFSVSGGGSVGGEGFSISCSGSFSGQRS